MTTEFLPITITNQEVVYTEKYAVPDHKSLSVTPHLQDVVEFDSATYSFQVSNNGVNFYDYPHDSALQVDINNALELPRKLTFLFIRFAVYGNQLNTGEVVFKVNYG